ncbi:glycosyltransferase family 2 protein [Nocardioides sp.]|uniref:glycosyltransferase family 2 protein n=1 Tax=Nocardioides sp. TaxID=35761 RepID=UPI003783D76D
MSGVALVTIAHGRHDHLRGQHASLARGSLRPDLYVVVAMADPVIEDWPVLGGLRPTVVPVDVGAEGLPLAAARNLGFGLARDAGCDVLVGLDVDCLAGPTLLAAYDEVVRDEPDRVWAGPVTYLEPRPVGDDPLDRLDELDDPHPARPAPVPGERRHHGDLDLFWSLSFATSATTWDRSGGFCEDYVGYGGEDTDFGRRLGSAGIDLAWVGSARAYHQHHPVSSPPVEHVDDILRNGRIFRDRWGTWPMLGWLTELERHGIVERRGDEWVRTDHRERTSSPS